MSSCGWRFASASVIGTSHLKQVPPVCQDYSYCGVAASSGGEIFLAVAADGAGSASCSAEGAKMTCESVQEFFSGFVSGERSFSEITRETAADCISTCQAKLGDLATTTGIASREFACTVLFAMITPTSSAFFQIGDGAIVVDGIDCDPFNWVFWPDRGEYENTTVFVTQEEALDHLQFDIVDRQIHKIALFTDGIQNLALDLQKHVPHAPFFAALFSHLSTYPPGWSAHYADNLREFLGSDRVNNRTDDDKTLIIALRD